MEESIPARSATSPNATAPPNWGQMRGTQQFTPKRTHSKAEMDGTERNI